jgi:hypothetical protein
MWIQTFAIGLESSKDRIGPEAKPGSDVQISSPQLRQASRMRWF